MSRLSTAFVAAVAAVGMSLSAAPSYAAELINNGDFELGLAGWMVTGQVAANTAADYGPCCGTTGSEPNYSTNHFAAIGGGNLPGGHSLSQSFATLVGSLYTLSFDAGAFGQATNVLITSVGGVTQNYTLTANNNADTTFASYGFTFTGSGSDTLTFAVNTGADNTDALVDNVSVMGAAVPEPTTWALMILGFGSAGAMLRRRRSVGAAY